MSGLTIYARTNLFRGRNVAVLLAMLAHYDVKVHTEDRDGATYVSILGNDSDTGDFPDKLCVSDEMREFSDTMAELFRFNKQDVVAMPDEDLFNELRKMCDLHGKHASDEDIETLMTLVRSDDPEDIDIDFGELVAPFVDEGEVLVLHMAGMEGNNRGPRSVFGYSKALINTGESVRVDLYDIYKLAKLKFGIDPTVVGP